MRRAPSNSLKALVEPVIDEDPAALAEQELAFLLDPDDQPLQLANLERVGFGQRFVEKADLVFDFLGIDPNAKLAEQLVEGILNDIPLQLTEFQAEFHSSWLLFSK